MLEFSRPLGDTIKRERLQRGLTQNELAENIGIDCRTVLNIENYKGNPKMEILYPLVRFLRIDPREVFYPDTEAESPALLQLKLLAESCSEKELSALISVCHSVLAVLRCENTTPIE